MHCNHKLKVRIHHIQTIDEIDDTKSLNSKIKIKHINNNVINIQLSSFMVLSTGIIQL